MVFQKCQFFYSSSQQSLEVLSPGALIPGRLRLPGTLHLYLNNVYFVSALARARQIKLYLRIPEHGKRPRAQDVVLQGSSLLSTVAHISGASHKNTRGVWWTRQSAVLKWSDSSNTSRKTFQPSFRISLLPVVTAANAKHFAINHVADGT